MAEAANKVEMSGNVTILNHPLVHHKMTLLRRTETTSVEFNALLREIGWYLGYEALSDLALQATPIETPVCATEGQTLKGRHPALITILRAGDGLLAPLRDILPSAKVGHIGMARDEETLQPVTYYQRLPRHLDQRTTILVDPMLATAGSAIAAVDLVKQQGATDIKMICLVAAPEGVAAFTKAHPDVALTVAALDERLNEHGYIVPGLGDAGDRIFGTD